MAFNYIDIILVAIFLIMVIIGYCKGLFITIVNFIRYSVGLFLCFYLSTNLAQPIYTNIVKPRALQKINSTIVTSTNMDEVLANLKSFGNSLPKILTDNIDFSSISLSSDDVANSILNNLFEPILLWLTKAAIFAIVFIVFFVATGIIIHLVRKISNKSDKKSKLKKVDRVFGAIFGMLKGAVIVLAICSILMYALSLGDDTVKNSEFLTTVSNSQLLGYIDSINPFNAVTEGII